MLPFETAANNVSPSLTSIMRQSIVTGIFPENWKMAKVSPVFMSGRKSDLDNYRPISIISVLAKVFEKVVYNQFYKYLTDNKYQSGFRSLHSAITAFPETTDNWCVNIDNGFINGIIFINLKKAFDTVGHGILLRQLAHYGVNQNTLRWFESYLTN